MLNRFFVHLCLILMFAVVQTGIAMHAISHINEHTQESQLSHNQNDDDSNTLESHCGQCLAYAQADGALPNHDFLHIANDAIFELSTAYQAHLATVLTPAFSARAPPAYLNLA